MLTLSFDYKNNALVILQTYQIKPVLLSIIVNLFQVMMWPGLQTDIRFQYNTAMKIVMSLEKLLRIKDFIYSNCEMKIKKFKTPKINFMYVPCHLAICRILFRYDTCVVMA